jgi:hypothetical protein
VTGEGAALDLALEHGGGWLRCSADPEDRRDAGYGCRAASAAHRRCGSAAPTPPRRSAAPTPRPGTPGRPWSWQRGSNSRGPGRPAREARGSLGRAPGSRSGPRRRSPSSPPTPAGRPRGVHRREHHGCVEVVVRGVARRLGEVDACPTINAWWDTASPSGSRGRRRGPARAARAPAGPGACGSGASRRTGSWPSAASRSATCDPTNPAPPVTRTRARDER